MSQTTVILEDRFKNRVNVPTEDPIPMRIMFHGVLYVRVEGILYREADVRKIDDTMRSFRLEKDRD